MWQVRVHNTNTAFKIPLPVSYEVKFSSSSLSTLRYVPREMTVCVHKAMYTTLCNSIVRVSNWNKFKCLLTGKWINKCGVSTGQAIRLSKEKKDDWSCSMKESQNILRKRSQTEWIFYDCIWIKKWEQVKLLINNVPD